jgi:hypothetical protein
MSPRIKIFPLLLETIKEEMELSFYCLRLTANPLVDDSLAEQV